MNHEVTVELKNDISVRGTLKSVDQYLNIKLDDISVVEELKYPHLVSRIEHRKEYKRRDYVLDIEKILAYMLRVGRRQRTAMLTRFSQSSVKNVFIRGSVVRYVHLPANAVDTPLLEDATRRGTKLFLPHVTRKRRNLANI